MKLMAICWLVLPHFNGACQVYDCLIRPWLYVNPQNAIKQFITPKEDLSLNGENFLAVAERYVKENGSEALEKLIHRKSEHTNPNIEVEEVKAVTNTREKEPAAAIQAKFKEPKIAEDAEAMEQTEKDPTAATKWSKLEETNCAKENAKSGELKEKNPAPVTEWVKFVEPNLAPTEKETVAAGELKEKTVPEPNHAQPQKKSVAAGKIKEKTVPEPNHAQPQKKSVAAGELKENTVPEPNHAQKKSVAAGELKENTVPEPNHAQPQKKSVAAGELTEKTVPEPNHAQPQKKTVAAGEIKEKTVVAGAGENKAMEETPPLEKVQKEWTCAVCQVFTTCEKNLNSHLQGKKHKAKYDAMKSSKQATKNKGCSSSTANDREPKKSASGDRSSQPKAKKQEDKVQVNWTAPQFKQKEPKNTGSGMNQPKFLCTVCDVKCLSEIDMASHINGKKHLTQIQHLIDSLGRGI